ncbi:PAS domain S-box protein, partial [Flavitalea antarctica]
MEKGINDSAPSEKLNQFLIAGIGASAGGIQALRKFFEQVPGQSGVCYVVILHLSPSHDSQLAEVLQAVSAIPVQQVVEKTILEPDHIYVVPPNQHLIIEDGFIAPSVNINTDDRRSPVDLFFRNLADTHGQRSVCVILSGTGANGSMGLKRIKEMGGMAFVQNPREAEFNEMPRNAIATELIDEVLPVAEIPARIIACRDRVGSVQINLEALQGFELHQQALRQIFTQLRIHTGHDFTNYKRATILRRIERRINITNLPDLPAYAKYVNENSGESTALLKDLLISVTNFFRDAKPFEALENEVIPLVFQNKKPEDQVRIWVAGCATGEEAYSIAMLFAERLEGTPNSPKVQIFATDIDESAIATAREGYYTLNDAADVSPDRLQRFFTPEGEGYRIRREIREMILFATHNFLKDPPFSRLNLVSCRNVLIYLNPTAQERVMETFHFTLAAGGFLFLGTSESVEGVSELYSTVSRENHIFKARQVLSRNWSIPESVPRFRYLNNEERKKPDDISILPGNRFSSGELHQKLLEKYAPPSLVVNEDYEIVHMSEKVGKYLEFKGGTPTQNLLELIRPEIRLELRSILHQALQTRTTVAARGLNVVVGGQPQAVDIKVQPVFQDDKSSQGLILVTFEQLDTVVKNEQVVLSSVEPVAKQLEDELNRVKTHLRTSIEQHEYQSEELKASNEELQAMNEELRSAAEELETSKEELQSINEELRTVNQELKVKIEELGITGNNLRNFINSADVGTIFLDRSFAISLFTPAVLQIFNLKMSDVGRPVTDITTKLIYDELMQDAEIVLNKLATIEREVSTTDNRTFVMRLLPYRTFENTINGVVLTFFDITNRKLIQNALQQSEEYLRLLIESAQDYAILTLDPNRKVVSWSIGAHNIMGYMESEITGKSGDLIFTIEDLRDGAPIKEADKAAREGRAQNERWHVRKDGTMFWGSGSLSPLRNGKGELLGFVKIMRDLTEARRLEEAKFFLASVVETSNDSIITIDFERKITSWNKSAEKLYGYTAEEVIGKNLTLLTLPKDFIKILNKIDIVEHSRKVAVFDTVRAHKDGQHMELEVVMSPVMNALDQVIGVSTIARDITGRKRREANLAFLAEINLDFAPLLQIDEIMEQIGKRLFNHLDLSRCALAFVDNDADRINVVYELRRDEKTKSMAGVHPISEILTPAGRERYAAGTMSVIIANEDNGILQNSTELLSQLGIGSMVEVPLLEDTRWTFLLSVGRQENEGWQADELELLVEVASRVYIRIERARAERALRISEERFRTLTNAVPQVIWANNEKGEANYFNKGWYEYSGLTYEQSYGSGWEAIVHTDDAHESKQVWNTALATGQIFDTEYRLRNVNGDYRWFIGRNVPVKDSTGKVFGWFGSATDIENLKQAEELLQSTTDRLHLALEAGKLGSFEYDFKTKLVSGSLQLNETFGYSPDESVSLESFVSLVSKKDQIRMEQEVENVIRDRSIYNVEFRANLQNGGFRWLKSSGRGMYDSYGEPQKFVGIVLDITEQKLFTEELSRLVTERTYEL